MNSYLRGVAFLSGVLLSQAGLSDQNTPSGGPGGAVTSEATLQVPGSRPVSFERASLQLTSVFPIQISRFDQLTQQSYNWHGETDASLACQIGFTPEAVVVSGTVLDDQPLVQVHTRPGRPNWWRIRYGADGIEFHIEDVTSSTQVLRFFLNFGSAGVNPRIELAQSPSGLGSGFLESASVELAELEPIAAPGQEPGVPPAGFRFRAVLPSAGLLEPKFFSGALQMVVRLHDLDGAFSTYCCLEERLEKAP